MRYTSWTPEDLEENERMMREEKRAYMPQPLLAHRLRRFGFTEKQAQGIVERRNKYLRVIPDSFLVQTFMRKLRYGMDRCRP